MRGDVASLQVRRPRDLAEACAMRADGHPVPLAGGTDLFVGLNDGKSRGGVYLDLSRVAALKPIGAEKDALWIGATATYTDLRRSAAVKKLAPVLQAVARDVGAVAIQNRGTLGGSLGNASPASDPAPVLMALNAGVSVASATERRVIPMGEFFTGYRATSLKPDELITAVFLAREDVDGFVVGYRKVGTRRAQAISKVVLASALKIGKGGRVEAVRLAFGSVAATTVRARRAEAALLGEVLDAKAIVRAQNALSEDIHPIDDIRSTADYRTHVARNLLAAQLSAARAKGKG